MCWLAVRRKAPDTAAVEAMIRAHTAAWVEAYNAGDADKIVAGYTDDAVLMPPDAPAATGHEAMKQFLVGDMASAKAAGSTLTLDSDTVGVSGDLAWHSGTFHVNGSAGSPVGSREISRGVEKGCQRQLAHDQRHLEQRRRGRGDGPAAGAGAEGCDGEARSEEETQEEMIFGSRPAAARAGRDRLMARA